MKSPGFFPAFAFLFVSTAASAVIPHDSLPDNLVHSPGYRTSEWGSLPCQKSGSGPQTLLILPGWGFDGSIFRDFIEDHQSEYTMYLLTLPGYGAARAYPMPPEGTSYGEGNWMKGVEKGILDLLEAEKLERPVLLAHFAVASHIALRLAAEHPGKFEKVVLLGAPAAFRNPPPYDTLGHKGRVRAVDQYLAPQWFRTVSMETWRKGNFPPGVYSVDSLAGRQLFEQANAAPLPVQIRYLCEYWAADYACYEQVDIPVLAVIPSFSAALLKDPANFYLSWYTDEWLQLATKNKNIRPAVIEGSGCNVMQDQPEVLGRLLGEFLEKK